MKECVKRLWNTLKTTFLSVRLLRLCKSHHLQCITSSKDSEKLEKSLCVILLLAINCPAKFTANSNQTHLKQLIKVLRQRRTGAKKWPWTFWQRAAHQTRSATHRINEWHILDIIICLFWCIWQIVNNFKEFLQGTV